MNKFIGLYILIQGFVNMYIYVNIQIYMIRVCKNMWVYVNIGLFVICDYLQLYFIYLG